MPIGTTAMFEFGAASTRPVIACIVAVVACVVAVHDRVMLDGVTPAVFAAASCRLTSWRSGSSAQAFASVNAGRVDLPPVQSGLVRLAKP